MREDFYSLLQKYDFITLFPVILSFQKYSIMGVGGILVAWLRSKMILIKNHAMILLIKY